MRESATAEVARIFGQALLYRAEIGFVQRDLLRVHPFSLEELRPIMYAFLRRQKVGSLRLRPLLKFTEKSKNRDVSYPSFSIIVCVTSRKSIPLKRVFLSSTVSDSHSEAGAEKTQKRTLPHAASSGRGD